MIQEPKQPNQVRGNRIRCPKFIQCPLCYGCRAYSTADLDCIECSEENKKKNICNTELHREDLISQFITKNKIEIDEEITFQSEV